MGSTYQWRGGQGPRHPHVSCGLVGCGIYDIRSANEFNLVVAIARGTPQKPLRVPEAVCFRPRLEVSQAAEKLGVTPGMTGGRKFCWQQNSPRLDPAAAVLPSGFGGLGTSQPQP